MKHYLIIIILLLSSILAVAATDTNEILCMKFVKEGDNYKIANKNKSCLKAANAGISSAQYSVGMGYGFSGKSKLEKEYYRKAANQRNIAAYLALGHTLRDENIWESIYWYQRYIATKTDGYGVAAYLLAEIFTKLNNKEQSAYWRQVCEQSPYTACGRKSHGINRVDLIDYGYKWLTILLQNGYRQ